jgi:hypothetical protein
VIKDGGVGHGGYVELFVLENRGHFVGLVVVRVCRTTAAITPLFTLIAHVICVTAGSLTSAGAVHYWH